MYRRLYRPVLWTVFLLIAVLIGSMVSWKRPVLPRTSLTGMEQRTYVYTLRKLTEPSARPVGLSFSLRECSRLVERFPPPLRRYGFELRDLYLEPHVNSARILAVVQGPAGLFYRVNFRGKARLENRRWNIRLEQLRVGWLPAGWVLPGSWNPDWPTQWAGGRITLLRARMDGEGVSALVRTPPKGLSLSLDDFVNG